MTSVVVYHSSVPNKKNQEKVDLLKYFSEGIKRHGDLVIDNNSYQYQASDVAVIQGWITEGDKNRPHLQLRHQVIENQLSRKKHVVVADSNMFLYSNTNNPQHYLRYSFNGVFPNTGIYCDTNPDPSRWADISKNLNLSLKDYRTSGDHILLCLQRNGGWSMSTQPVVEWAAQVIVELREYTDRPIRIRPHPGDKKFREYLGNFNSSGLLKNVSLSSPGSSLIDDLRNCWAAINHNSSPVVGAAIEGYPIFVTDPERSQCAEIANLDLSQIENPQLPDRQRWVERLAMSHWKFNELRSGQCWAHMRKFI